MIEYEYKPVSSNCLAAKIKKLSKINGTNAKASFLGKHPNLTSVLYMAYNPFIKFGLTSKHFKDIEYGSGEFTEQTFKILNDLSAGDLSGNKAILAVETELMGFTKASADLFLKILDKDLKIGMAAKSINKVFKNLIPTNDVMLAKLFDSKKAVYPCYASPKLDGVRGIKRGNFIVSRNGHRYIGLDHIIKELEPHPFTFDGELLIPNKSFQESSGLIRNNLDCPNAKFYIFDIPGIRVSFGERLDMMKEIVLGKSSVILIPHIKVYNEAGLMDFYERCRNKGFEGAVIKPIDYKYKGTRSYDWMKLKPRDTVDLNVIGVYEGTGKYKNALGGVYVDYNGKEDKVGSGFRDDQRIKFWQDPNLIINKTIEVEFMEETNDGHMRHASFKWAREDK